jgi:hypothetical protein
MDFWDAPITIAQLIALGLLALPELLGVAAQPGIEAERRAPSHAAAPLPVAETCRLVPGRWGAPGRYECPAAAVK